MWTTVCSSVGKRAAAIRTRRGDSLPASDSPIRRARGGRSKRSPARSPTWNGSCDSARRALRRNSTDLDLPEDHPEPRRADGHDDHLPSLELNRSHSMILKKLALAAVVTAVGLIAVTAAFAASPLTNPGFETGDFTGWS